MTPLDYLLSVMRNEDEDTATRMEAARAAASFVHPKLSSVQQDTRISGEDTLSQLLADVAANGRCIHDRVA